MVAPIDAPWSGQKVNDSNLGNTTVGHGTSDPTTYEVGRMFLRTDTGLLYYNSGTEGTPVFTEVNPSAPENIYTFIQDNLTIPDATNQLVTLETNNAGRSQLYRTIGTTDDLQGGQYKYASWNDLGAGAAGRWGFTSYANDAAIETAINTTDNTVFSGDATNDRVDFVDINAAVQEENAYIDLMGTIIDNDQWSCRFKLDVSTFTQGADTDQIYMFVGMTSGTGKLLATHDHIGMQIYIDNTTQDMRLKHGDAENLLTQGHTADVLTSLSATTYYVEITRQSDTTCRIRVYSDSTYTTSLGLASSSSLNATSVSMRYFNMGFYSSGTHDHALEGSISDIEFFDDSEHIGT